MAKSEQVLKRSSLFYDWESFQNSKKSEHDVSETSLLVEHENKNGNEELYETSGGNLKRSVLEKKKEELLEKNKRLLVTWLHQIANDTTGTFCLIFFNENFCGRSTFLILFCSGTHKTFFPCCPNDK